MTELSESKEPIFEIRSYTTGRNIRIYLNGGVQGLEGEKIAVVNNIPAYLMSFLASAVPTSSIASSPGGAQDIPVKPPVVQIGDKESTQPSGT